LEMIEHQWSPLSKHDARHVSAARITRRTQESYHL
jgi:hypothetical protein